MANIVSTDVSPEIVLRMSGISKHFGPVQALSDVSFEVRRGTVHALCGENGAGKSTLMKVLAGVHQPDSGGIEIDGRPRRFARPSDALTAGISMIYQELDLAEDLTPVAENIFSGCGTPGQAAVHGGPAGDERRDGGARPAAWLFGEGRSESGNAFDGGLPDC